MRKLLSCTGGGAKFIEIIIALDRIIKGGYRPTDIIVKSSSALAILFVILGKYLEGYKEGADLDLKKFFKSPPTDGKGQLTLSAKFRAIWSFMPSVIGGDINSFGVQDVRPLLLKYISDADFELYRNGPYPNIWIVTVDPSKGTQGEYLHFDNLKDCANVKTAADLIEASAQIQGNTEGVYIGDSHRFDGGMYLAGAAGYMIKNNFFENVAETVSIYSYTDSHYGTKDSDSYKKDIGSNAARIIEMLKNSNKYFCREHEYELCINRGIKRLEVNLPDVIDNLYGADAETVNRAILETEIKMDKYLSEYKF